MASVQFYGIWSSTDQKASYRFLSGFLWPYFQFLGINSYFYDSQQQDLLQAVGLQLLGIELKIQALLSVCLFVWSVLPSIVRTATWLDIYLLVCYLGPYTGNKLGKFGNNFLWFFFITSHLNHLIMRVPYFNYFPVYLISYNLYNFM